MRTVLAVAGCAFMLAACVARAVERAADSISETIQVGEREAVAVLNQAETALLLLCIGMGLLTLPVLTWVCDRWRKRLYFQRVKGWLLAAPRWLWAKRPWRKPRS